MGFKIKVCICCRKHVFLKMHFSDLQDVFLRYCYKHFFAFETCICIVGHLRINGCRDKSLQEANNIYRCRCVSSLHPLLCSKISKYFLNIPKKGFKLSSPRAERARAVTGRRCPHSGVGEDFLPHRRVPLMKMAVTRKQKVKK